mmetsp:Transcript_6176/g.9614  ORF Transcript_6176/g.9614 Transcript_6176/m.9614 type:complete len:168 (+) Transcript_6176:1391-1894(+)
MRMGKSLVFDASDVNDAVEGGEYCVVAFQAGDLGFEFLNRRVSLVRQGDQADLRGVLVGWETISVQGFDVESDTEIYTEIQKFHRVLESFCVVFRTTAPLPTESDIFGDSKTDEGGMEKEHEAQETIVPQPLRHPKPRRQRIVVITHPGGNPDHMRVNTGKNKATNK